MWKKVAKVLLSIFWPEIKKLISKYVKSALAWLETKLKDYFGKRNDANAKEAEAKAASAMHRAEQATETSEAEKWEAVASVWREVAEKFRKENESLESELASIRAAADNKTQAHLEGLELDEAFVVTTDEIKAIDYKPIMLDPKS